MKKAFILFLSLWLVNSVFATDWYVMGTGNDSNNGKTAQTAFRSLQKASDLVQPGDIVYIGDGVYSDSDVESAKYDGSALLHIRRSGTPDAWITWKALPNHRPEIRPISWGGIVISGSYHILDGLSIVGSNDSVYLKEALEDINNDRPTAKFNTNGIYINGRICKPESKPHHVVIRNCSISKCGGGGITAIETDYITIEDCKVFDNAWYMRYAGSGITTLNNWAFDDAPGYHIIIQRNYVWNNKCMVPWERIGKLSDGNGILLDVTDQDNNGSTNPDNDAVVNKKTSNKAPAAKPQRPIWKGRALITNNVSCYNGGSGIHVFRTKHVDIINNTTYWNGQTVGYQEIFPNCSEDIVILNNIMVPRPGGDVTSNNKNTNIHWDYNLYPVSQNIFKGENDIVADPMFLDPQTNPTKGNFRLQEKSLGLNSASEEVAQPTDISGIKRPSGAGRDRGAYEQ